MRDKLLGRPFFESNNLKANNLTRRKEGLDFSVDNCLGFRLPSAEDNGDVRIFLIPKIFTRPRTSAGEGTLTDTEEQCRVCSEYRELNWT